MQVLQTERLHLRRLTLEDATFMLELLNDPLWIKFFGQRRIHTLETAQDYLKQGPLFMYDIVGFGLWMVERKEDSIPIGVCGLIKRDIFPEVDVSFALLPKYRGYGYAKEAVTATLAYGSQNLGLNQILAIISPDNHRSIKLIESVGMHLLHKLRLPNENDIEQDTLLFSWKKEPTQA